MCRGGEYMSSHHYTDSGQKEEIPVESSKHVKGPQAENSLVDWKKGIMFYFRDEIFYREILQMFLDSHSDMELRRYYEESDFENYRMYWSSFLVTLCSEIMLHIEPPLVSYNY